MYYSAESFSETGETGDETGDRREVSFSLNLLIITSQTSDVKQISENVPSVPDFPDFPISKVQDAA